MDGEDWGEEEEDEDDEEEEEEWEEGEEEEEEEEEEGEEGGLIDWPVEREGEGEEEDWSALTADGWIDMDAILVRREERCPSPFPLWTYLDNTAERYSLHFLPPSLPSLPPS
jgi:hypothetical protein